MIGLPNEPKWGHLRDLHRAIKLSEAALVSSDPAVTSLGNNLEVTSMISVFSLLCFLSFFLSSQFSPSLLLYFQAHVFRSKTGDCAAFLANYNPGSAAKVSFGNGQYDLPPWSVSILPDCKTVVYNTATVRRWLFTHYVGLVYSLFPIWFYCDRHIALKSSHFSVSSLYQTSSWTCQQRFWRNIVTLSQVKAQSSQMKMIPVHSGFSWQSYNEETASSDSGDATTLDGLWEQISVTRDTTDYLWYLTE